MPAPDRRRLIIGSDVENYQSTDIVTGIQRVICETHIGLTDRLALEGIDVAPVRLRRPLAGGALVSHPYFSRDPVLQRQSVPPEAVDAFLFLDLNTGLDVAGLYREVQRHPRPIIVLVHDVIPLKDATVFPDGARLKFRRYLQPLLALADHVVVTSAQVERDVRSLGWQKKASIHVLPLGSTFSPRPPRPATDDRLSIVSVSTVEPRKGYLTLLGAFDVLRTSDLDVDLTVIGRAGWDTSNLFESITQHPEYGGRLRWFRDLDDVALMTAVRQASVGVMASQDEGFGLFLEEGLTLGLKMVVSDIPVFRERSQGNVWFAGPSPEELAESILTAHREPWRDPQRPVRRMSDFVDDVTSLLLDVTSQRRLKEGSTT